MSSNEKLFATAWVTGQEMHHWSIRCPLLVHPLISHNLSVSGEVLCASSSCVRKWWLFQSCAGNFSCRVHKCNGCAMFRRAFCSTVPQPYIISTPSYTIFLIHGRRDCCFLQFRVTYSIGTFLMYFNKFSVLTTSTEKRCFHGKR